MLSDAELNRARRVLHSLKGEVTLVVLRNGDAGNRMEELARQLTRISDMIKLRVEEGSANAPALAVEKAGRKAVVYRTLPVGRELTPFLETLKAAGGNSLPEVVLKPLKPEQEVELLVFVTSSCPRCARVVKRCNMLALRESWIRSVVVDALVEEKLREEYEVTAAPTLVVDGKLKLEGDASLREITDAVEAVLDRRRRAEVVRQMLARGLAEKAGEWAARDAAVAEVLVGLIADSSMRVKMGAMLALEELFRARPEMLRKLHGAFERLLDHEKENVRGDAAWVIERAKKFM